MKAAVNQIVSDFHTSSEKFMTAPSESKYGKFRRTVSNPRAYLPTAVLLVILVTLIIAVPMTLNNRNQNQGEETTTGSELTTKSDDETSTGSSEATTFTSTADPETETTTFTSTEEPTSTFPTEPPPPELEVVAREAWLTKGLNISGRYKQLTPVSKIIVTSTQSDACYDSETCIDFMALRQLHAYPLLDDVRENFLIDASGAVYEGRGFHREGQTSGESLTSYDNKAVSISFILGESESFLSSEQQRAFCDFVRLSIVEGALEENFVVFKRSSLLASYDDAENDSLSVGACELNWGKRRIDFK